MTDIRYVCISDLHLGEEDSILTALNKNGVDPDTPSPVMTELVECLKELISKNKGKKKPTLILNGDILELALSTINTSTMVFERFLELFMKRKEELFEKIIYIPGNHDHHMWEQIRETQYLGYIRRHPHHKLPVPWSKTPMFLEELDHPPHCYFLECVLKRYSMKFFAEDATFAKNIKFAKNLKILVAYPNLGLRSTNSGRCIVIHHGHFLEPVYRIMSTLKTIWKEKQKKKEDDNGFPETIQKLEEENFAWIDFLWSALGRSGDVGNQTEAIYEHMHNSEYTQKYISKKADTVAKKIKVPIIPCDYLEKEGIELVLRWAFGEFSKKEHRGPDTEINEEINKDISLYLKTTEKQIKEECYEWTPSDWFFVFGHTHKPLEKQIFIDSLKRRVSIYNTGGWVVDTTEPNPKYGGSVVLIDDELNIASLHMYKEEIIPDQYCVEVKPVNEDGEDNPFYTRIRDLVDCKEEPWKKFSSTAHYEVGVREERLRVRLLKQELG